MLIIFVPPNSLEKSFQLLLFSVFPSMEYFVKQEGNDLIR